MNTLVVYYSHTGNNRYLAQRIARDLGADIEPIRPRLDVFFFLIFSSLLIVTFGIKRLEHDVGSYDKVVLVGPIWMGNLITPLRSFVKRYRKDIKKLYFVTSCGGGEDQKDEKFGYKGVFRKVEKYYGKPPAYCEAFPIKLLVPEDMQKDDDAMMKARLTEETFKGPIVDRYDAFISRISGGSHKTN
ncbi:MAG: flavodoxin domain-containing protein [Candidatus Thermoplasmatota archaeon]|nr:flavodoxin domain-containing protein [Candidatus Thermoplasmatota archaeon]